MPRARQGETVADGIFMVSHHRGGLHVPLELHSRAGIETGATKKCIAWAEKIEGRMEHRVR